MKKEITIAIMGFGTVGSGTYKILTKNRELIRDQVGMDIVVKKILVRDINKKRLVEVPQELITTDAEDILGDAEIDVVVELMGGQEQAYSYIMEALDRDKHVVTANKELMAKRGREILTKADERGLSVGFEASVCGGIPIIRALKTSLSTDKVNRIMGIVNGTTNYILTKMSQEGSEYEEALGQAKSMGFAEADPTSDVEGFDAAYKMAILSSIGFHTKVDINKVKREGISKITKIDIEYANELGWTIKLLGIAKDIEGKLEISVGPVMLPKDHPLALVKGVNNAVFINSEAIGELMFYGPGAGQMATGNSVAADIMDIGRQIALGNNMKPNCSCFADKTYVEDSRSSYYTRINVVNRPGVLAQIASVFGNYGVSIESVFQKKTEAERAEVVWITSKVEESSFRKAIELIKSLDVVNDVSSIIRVEANGYC
ncbi:homoserine dehydrogenase [Lutispora thermophila]|uniref:Homoserine dehydrogenase n=1 Tax=Lutispora thermophila DSM 19022 TaxID=1122184 RepID=A0A1M6AY49_9FIRM|nr:homoserine dehydrogenase [Lutispora thermophila]SHI41439.1 homoserine dehydrogenase [Lutispora thermophila DSM 19022]